jgi:hypothetical protein
LGGKGHRLGIIQALRPLANKPEMRQVFLENFKLEWSNKIRTTIIDILAPQLDRKDVCFYFLEVAEDKNWPESQVAVIDKLETVVHMPEVSSVLLKLLNTSTGKVKAACMRALSAHPEKRLIQAEDILIACMDSKEVRAEALRILKLWVTG